MAGNARAFALQIDKDLERAEDELREVVMALAFQGLTRIVQRTPVDTGRARGNWTVSVGSQDFTITEAVDIGGSVAIAEGQEAIAAYEAQEGWPSIYIQNNLPYIERLEDGSSSQAPSGMAALTFAELQAAVK